MNTTAKKQSKPSHTYTVRRLPAQRSFVTKRFHKSLRSSWTWERTDRKRPLILQKGFDRKKRAEKGTSRSYTQRKTISSSLMAITRNVSLPRMIAHSKMDINHSLQCLARGLDPNYRSRFIARDHDLNKDVAIQSQL